MAVIRMYMNMEMEEELVDKMCQDQNCNVDELALALKLGLMSAMGDVAPAEDGVKLDFDVEVIDY